MYGNMATYLCACMDTQLELAAVIAPRISGSDSATHGCVERALIDVVFIIRKK